VPTPKQWSHLHGDFARVISPKRILDQSTVASIKNGLKSSRSIWTKLRRELAIVEYGLQGFDAIHLEAVVTVRTEADEVLVAFS